MKITVSAMKKGNKSEHEKEEEEDKDVFHNNSEM